MSNGIHTTILGEERPDHGLFVIRRERWRMAGNPDVEMRVAYSLDGHYVGNPDEGIVKMLVEKQIVPELKRPDSNVCSVGKSRLDSKWYGWSHRCAFGYNNRNDAVKFADEVASLNLGWHQDIAAFDTRENACYFDEEVATLKGINVENVVDPSFKKRVAALFARLPKPIPLITGDLHATIFRSAAPGFTTRPISSDLIITPANYQLARFGLRYTQLALLITSPTIDNRRKDLTKKYRTWGTNKGYSVANNPAIAGSLHVTLSNHVPPEILNSEAAIAKIGELLRREVGPLKFIGERVKDVPIVKLLPRVTTPEMNRQRLAQRRTDKETGSMKQPARIVPRRQATDPLLTNDADLMQRLTDMYERRKIAALVGQGRTVQQLNARIRLLRAVNNLPEDTTTRPLYVAVDSNIDPRGGLMAEHAARLRGHRRVMDLFAGVSNAPEPEQTLNICYDLDWSNGHTMRGLAEAFKILNRHGYVARKSVPERDVHAYEFTSCDGSDSWTFTCCRGADWCYEVAHNGKVLAGTFTIRPGAPVEEQGVPESMLRDGWDGKYDPLEAQRYIMGWRNVLAMIRSHAEKLGPCTVDKRKA